MNLILVYQRISDLVVICEIQFGRRTIEIFGLVYKCLGYFVGRKRERFLPSFAFGVRGLVVLDGMRELGLHIGMDSFKDIFVAGDDRVCIPYLRENGDGVGEGSGSGSGGCGGGGRR